MWIVYVIGYLLGAFVTVSWGYNIAVTNEYRATLEKYKKYQHYDQDKVGYAERALVEAKRDLTDVIPFIVCMGGCFWPIYFVGIVCYKAGRLLRKLPTFKTSADREVQALRKAKALSDSRKAEWELALKTMSDAGIDTKELRKIKID